MSWIKIIDSDPSTLPAVGEEVLCYNEEGSISVEKRRKNEDHIYAETLDAGLVTHWMPLPTPPTI